MFDVDNDGAVFVDIAKMPSWLTKSDRRVIESYIMSAGCGYMVNHARTTDSNTMIVRVEPTSRRIDGAGDVEVVVAVKPGCTISPGDEITCTYGSERSRRFPDNVRINVHTHTHTSTHTTHTHTLR